MSTYLLGLDYGTGGAKVAIINTEGQVLGFSFEEYPFIHQHPGWSEHDAGRYWEAACRLIQQALAHLLSVREPAKRGLGLGLLAVSGRVHLERPDSQRASDRTPLDLDIGHHAVGHHAFRAGDDPAAHQQILGTELVLDRLTISRHQEKRGHEPGDIGYKEPQKVRQPQLRDESQQRKGEHAEYKDPRHVSQDMCPILVARPEDNEPTHGTSR